MAYIALALVIVASNDISDMMGWGEVSNMSLHAVLLGYSAENRPSQWILRSQANVPMSVASMKLSTCNNGQKVISGCNAIIPPNSRQLGNGPAFIANLGNHDMREVLIEKVLYEGVNLVIFIICLQKLLDGIGSLVAHVSK